MNLSELFFFKVFECVQDSNNNNKLNKSSHNEKNCYFYHSSLSNEKDKRREPISFTEFFQKLKTNLEEGSITITLDTIFEFKNKENNFGLNYYTNKPSFQNYNSYIYTQFDFCKNDTEFFYHIKNYKNKKCKYNEINIKCKKKYCDKYHNNEKNINEDNGINYMRNIIDSWIEKNEIKLIEIIEVFNKILSYDNKLLKYKLNEIKQDFEPFLKFYNEYKNANNNIKNNNNLLNINKYQLKDENKARRIMQEINRDLNPHNIKNKIHKNSDLFEALNISTNNISYISPSEILKSGELIKYIYAFLNSSNGMIIYGGKLLDNKYIVKGISIKQKDREKFKKWFNAEFLKILVEFEESLKYKFYDIANNNNEECVLVINIKQIKITKFLMPSSRNFYIIKEEILKNANQNNKIINEKDFIELDTKQYIEFLTKRFSDYYTKKFGISNIK